MPIRTKVVTVGTTATKIFSDNECMKDSTIVFQAQSGASCFIGDFTVTAAGSTQGILVPTAGTSGVPPLPLPLGGYELWGVVSTGTTNLVVLFIGPPYGGI